MNLQKMVVAGIVALLSIPAAAYADVYDTSATDVEVIEGHTVFVVLEKTTFNCPSCPPPGSNRSEQGTAVAVLTREQICQTYGAPADKPAFDGVLWFNDQFLVGEEEDYYTVPPPPPGSCYYRYPCGGTIYAVNSGVPDPMSSSNGWNVPTTTYVHSYKVTDPNDNEWWIDAYSISGVVALNALDFVWVTSPKNKWVADSATCNDAPFVDNPPAGYAGANGTAANNPVNAGGVDLYYSNVEYNGVLFMLWENIYRGPLSALGFGVADTSTVVLGENVSRDTDGDSSYNGPYTANNSTQNKTYSAGLGTGNSHPFNPHAHNETGGAAHTHETGQVDIYFHNEAPPVPATRTWYLDDTIGSDACFHEHGQYSADPQPPTCLNGYGAGPAYSQAYPSGLYAPLPP